MLPPRTCVHVQNVIHLMPEEEKGVNVTRFRERDAQLFPEQRLLFSSKPGRHGGYTAFPFNRLEATVSVVSLRDRVRSLQNARAFAVLCCGRSVGVSGPLSLFLSRQRGIGVPE